MINFLRRILRKRKFLSFVAIALSAVFFLYALSKYMYGLETAIYSERNQNGNENAPSFQSHQQQENFKIGGDALDRLTNNLSDELDPRPQKTQLFKNKLGTSRLPSVVPHHSHDASSSEDLRYSHTEETIATSDPPLVIVSAYQNMREIAKRSVVDKREYAKKWGYGTHIWSIGDGQQWWRCDEVKVQGSELTKMGIVVEPRHIREESRPVTWAKVPALLRAFKKYDNDGSTWFWWLDADAVITNPDIEATRAIIGRKLLASIAADKKAAAKRSTSSSGDDDVNNRTATEIPDLIISKDCKGMNTGSFLIRNTPFSRKLLLTLWHSPLRHTTSDFEQGVLQRLYDQRSGGLSGISSSPLHLQLGTGRHHVKFRKQRRMNSFPRGVCPELGEKTRTANTRGGQQATEPHLARQQQQHGISEIQVEEDYYLVNDTGSYSDRIKSTNHRDSSDGMIPHWERQEEHRRGLPLKPARSKKDKDDDRAKTGTYFSSFDLAERTSSSTSSSLGEGVVLSPPPQGSRRGRQTIGRPSHRLFDTKKYQDKHTWAPADFVLHIAGCWARDNPHLQDNDCLREFEWAWKLRQVGWQKQKQATQGHEATAQEIEIF